MMRRDGVVLSWDSEWWVGDWLRGAAQNKPMWLDGWLVTAPERRPFNSYFCTKVPKLTKPTTTTNLNKLKIMEDD